MADVLSNPGASLGGALEHACLLQHVQQLVAGAVDPYLSARFQVANIRQGRLILLAPTAAWATRLRLETTRLLDTLRHAGFTELRAIDVRVAPLVQRPAVVRPTKPLSAAAEQALGCMARLGAESEE